MSEKRNKGGCEKPPLPGFVNTSVCLELLEHNARASNAERLLPFIGGIRGADEIIIRCLTRWHQGDDLVAKLAIGAIELAAVPDFFEGAGEGAVGVPHLATVAGIGEQHDVAFS